MAYQHPPLPYAENALEPHISAKTIGFHYSKHHTAYVTNYNKMVAGTEFDSKSIEEVITAIAGDKERAGIFNNGAQAWNHTFYWNSVAPGGGGRPSGTLLEKISTDFGSFEAFTEELKSVAATQFGSGWAWLVLGDDILKVVKTSNAETPLTTGQKPLLCIDVWEHAYYLDYQNRRPDYIANVIDKLLNWKFAEDNFRDAIQ